MTYAVNSVTTVNTKTLLTKTMSTDFKCSINETHARRQNNTKGMWGMGRGWEVINLKRISVGISWR
jgi:hypothetical protein